ncbi:MAG: septum formation protein Maf [Bacteroidetes bacterium]|nr:septum formation protein Maf [Bacteroidota bacterium]
MKILETPIYLASQSPRRKELLERAGFRIRIQAVDLDETIPEGMPNDEAAEYLAREKAKAAIPFRKDSEILLAADSLVFLNEKVYAKPTDRNHAIQMLRELSGNTHRVITGVCLSDGKRLHSFSGISDVFMEDLTDEEIKFYVDTYKPYDKAGGYAIQEWIGLCRIRKIEGTYTNIMGLPMDLVYKHLTAFVQTES